MLCRKFKSILFPNTNNNVVYRTVTPSRSFSKWFDIISSNNMTTTSRFRMFKDVIFKKAFYAWTRSIIVNNVVRRYRRERGVKNMLQYFRQIFFRRKTHLAVYVSAVCTRNTEEKPGQKAKQCAKDIKDKDMMRYISDLDGIEELSKATLFCEGCDKRITVDSKNPHPDCKCPNSKPPATSYEGWMPYMETSDVIIWRKEHKPGLYAYKVYGRYKHIKAEDFALIQVDGDYRPVWDDAVASIAVVEKHAHGVHNQYILHWEVQWPRLFANRDYVYIRRHKKYTVAGRCLQHKDGIFPQTNHCAQRASVRAHAKQDGPERVEERPSVHSRAKQASIEAEARESRAKEFVPAAENKVYVIVSRSCVHPKVPEGNSAIRVNEYWSHMVVTTLHGPDKPGMEFVLTYYDEPAVGGLPTAITAWAMGRAGPLFIEKMRAAAEQYGAWRGAHPHGDTPNFQSEPANVSYQTPSETVCESDCLDEPPCTEESPDLKEETSIHNSPTSREQSTQTRPVKIIVVEGPEGGETSGETKVVVTIAPIPDTPALGPNDKSEINDMELCDHVDKTSNTLISKEVQGDNKTEKVVLKELNHEITPTPVLKTEQDRDSAESVPEKDSNQEEKSGKVSWWRYIYPFYYFV